MRNPIHFMFQKEKNTQKSCRQNKNVWGGKLGGGGWRIIQSNREGKITFMTSEN